MSLYYEAAALLSSASQFSGSLRSRVYDSKDTIKSSPPLVYALVTECAKWDAVLSEVIDHAGILSQERKVCQQPVSTSVILLTDTEALSVANPPSCRASGP